MKKYTNDEVFAFLREDDVTKISIYARKYMREAAGRESTRKHYYDLLLDAVREAIDKAYERGKMVERGEAI